MIPKALINIILSEFKDNIYTAFGEEFDKSFIFKYHERLDILYPKKDRHIGDNVEFDLTSLTIS